MKQLSINQMNQVLRNIQESRRGINIDNKDLMSAVARGCYIGQMPKNEMGKVINFLIYEGYLEVLNNRTYIRFENVVEDICGIGFGVKWYDESWYMLQTANIRKFDAKQKIKEVK